MRGMRKGGKRKSGREYLCFQSGVFNMVGCRARALCVGDGHAKQRQPQLTRSFFRLADFSTTTHKGVQSATLAHRPKSLEMCPGYKVDKIWLCVLVVRHWRMRSLRPVVKKDWSQ